jgi:hypothetical protein
VVLDTNTLVGSAFGQGSASRRIVEACLRGELVAVVRLALNRGQLEWSHRVAIGVDSGAVSGVAPGRFDTSVDVTRRAQSCGLRNADA